MSHLGLFAKYWEPGKVKTRLADQIGQLSAGRVYRSFVEHLIARLSGICYRQTIVFSPRDKRQEFESVAKGQWELVPQADGDLGDRLKHFFLTNLTQASAKVIVIGSDAPQLPPGNIAQAVELLDQVPVVIGPSSDGGYYLVAMRGQLYDLFDGISWSTEKVYRQTVERLKQNRVEFSMLPELTDVDRLPDLLRLQVQLEKANRRLDPLDRQLLASIADATEKPAR